MKVIWTGIILLCFPSLRSFTSPLKFEHCAASIYYYISFIILPKICPFCLGMLDCMLVLNQLGWKSVKWLRKAFCINAGADLQLFLHYFTIAKIMRYKMPGLETEPKFNAVMKSSASRLVPLGTSIWAFVLLSWTYEEHQGLPSNSPDLNLSFLKASMHLRFFQHCVYC